MIFTVVKRDGRRFGFCEDKIKNSIQRAMLESGKDKEDVLLAGAIACRIAYKGGEELGTGDIQTLIEKELVKSNREDVAELFTRCRKERDSARFREYNGEKLIA